MGRRDVNEAALGQPGQDFTHTSMQPGVSRIPVLQFRISGTFLPVLRHLAAAIPTRGSAAGVPRLARRLEDIRYALRTSRRW
jgi:hypothetical protein